MKCILEKIHNAKYPLIMNVTQTGGGSAAAFVYVKSMQPKKKKNAWRKIFFTKQMIFIEKPVTNCDCEMI